MSNTFIKYIDKSKSLSGDFMANFWSVVGLDLSFNSNARWDSHQQSVFLTSLVRGMAPSKIIVANIEDCMEYLNEDTEDYKYFKKWLDKGFKYIAIDGNNRTIAINDFLNNKVGILPGEYTVPERGTIKVSNNQVLYGNLPKSLKDYIDSTINVTVCEYTKAGRKELSQTFINVNSGVQLKPQELRNAILVPFGDIVRQLGEKYTSALKTVFKQGNKRRLVDEMIVSLAVHFAYRGENGLHGVSKGDRDRAYDDNSSVWQSFSEGGGKSLIEETLNMIGKYGTTAFKDVSSVLNLFMLMCEINSQKRKILDYEKLFKWFLKTENRRWADKEILVNYNRGESRTYAACCRATSPLLLNARWARIIKDFMEIEDGIVTDLDPNRLFTREQRYMLWVAQKGKCPQTGKIIPEEEINNHDLWAADHIIPYSKGGKTTLENGQLVCKKWNLMKSSKLIEELEAA